MDGPGSMQKVSQLRDGLRSAYPEVDTLFTDSYLSSVLLVPDRSFEYARDQKMANALQWRREFGVESLIGEICYENDQWTQAFVVNPDEDELMPGEEGAAVARPGVLEMCQAGHLAWRGEDDSGRPVLYSDAGNVDWTDVAAIIQHHVRLIEHGIRELLPLKQFDSFSVVVDVSGSSLFSAPPMEGLRGLVDLLQKAYPERIAHIYAVPVNVVLRGALCLSMYCLEVHALSLWSVYLWICLFHNGFMALSVVLASLCCRQCAVRIF